MERLRELSTASESTANGSLSFPLLLRCAAKHYGHRSAYSDHVNGCTHELSFADCLYWSNVIAHRVATLFPAPRCMIFSESRIEWPLAFYGILEAGGVAIPLDAQSSVQELTNALQTIAPQILMVSAKLIRVAEKATAIAGWGGQVLLLELHNEEDSRAIASLGKIAVSFTAPERHTDDIAIMIFTAGTSGNPKAVQLSFSNIFHQMHSLREAMALNPGDALLSVLPLNSVLELTCNLLTALTAGCHVHFPGSLLPNELKRALKQWKITHMIAVPRVMLAIEDLIKSRFKMQYGDEGSSRLNRIQHISQMTDSNVLRRHLNSSIFNDIGPCLHRVLVCGSTLNTSTLKFFYNMGIDILQSYGLVESSGMATVNLPNQSRFGSVGTALPDCAVRIQLAEGEKIGEILIRGPHVATMGTVDDDGWLHTEDWGFLTNDGFLYVMDRKANLIALEGDQKVFPGEIHKALSDSVLFEEICVMGINHRASADQHGEQICAVVVPKAGLRKLKSLSELEVLCSEEVSRKTKDLPAFKQPRHVIVRTTEIPKTRTGAMKVAQLKNELVKDIARSVRHS